MEERTELLKEKLVTACRILLQEGLIEAQYSISLRLDEEHMLINDNVGAAVLTKNHILVRSLHEEVTTGNVHPAIYLARKDVGAIVHAHPPYAIALSTVEEEFKPIHNYGVIFHGRIKVYEGLGQVGTKERAREIADLLGDGIAILQRGHGTITVGKGIEEALLATIYLEEAAKIHFFAKVFGQPKYIPPELSLEITKQVFKERSVKKAWEHYAAKVLRFPTKEP